MYHAIVLEDLLDLVNLSRSFPQVQSAADVSMLRQATRRANDLERSAQKNRALVLERFTREQAAAQLLEVLARVVREGA